MRRVEIEPEKFPLTSSNRPPGANVITVCAPDSVTCAPDGESVAAPAAKLPPDGLVTTNPPAAVPVHEPERHITRLTVAVTEPCVIVSPSAAAAVPPAVKFTRL